MPKEIVVNAWCDPCYRDGEHSPAEEVTVALGDLARMKPRVMLLCERHRKETYEPLRELLEEFGATTDSPSLNPAASKEQRRRTPPVSCKVCGQVLKNLGSLGSHLRQIHETTLTEYREEYGDPIKDEGGGSDPELFAELEGGSEPIGSPEETCEVCGKVYSHALGNKRPAQALGVHLARVHGISAESRRGGK